MFRIVPFGCVLMLVCGGFASAGPILSVELIQTGPQNSIVWDFGVSNSGTDPALNAEIDSLQLIQTAGAAGTPVIITPLPVALGTIAAGSSADGLITIDFTGFPDAALFTVNLGLSFDGGKETFTSDNVPISIDVRGRAIPFELLPGPSNPIPEPSTLVTSSIALSIFGVIALRKRTKRGRSGCR
jgi:hypothetical protein